MVKLIQIEEVEQLLLQLPGIEELQETQPAAFAARAAMWLDVLEQALSAAQADRATQVAVLRNDLLFARRKATQARARQLAADASKALAYGAELARIIVEESRPRFDDAQARLAELVTRAEPESVTTDPAYREVEELVGADDARFMLGRVVAANRSARVADGGQ